MWVRSFFSYSACRSSLQQLTCDSNFLSHTERMLTFFRVERVSHCSTALMLGVWRCRMQSCTGKGTSVFTGFNFPSPAREREREKDTRMISSCSIKQFIHLARLSLSFDCALCRSKSLSEKPSTVELQTERIGKWARINKQTTTFSLSSSFRLFAVLPSFERGRWSAGERKANETNECTLWVSKKIIFLRRWLMKNSCCTHKRRVEWRQKKKQIKKLKSKTKKNRSRHNLNDIETWKERIYFLFKFYSPTPSRLRWEKKRWDENKIKSVAVAKEGSSAWKVN